LSTVLNAKPDLEKAYKEGLAFANSKVEENKSIFKPRIGVCQKTTEEHDILKCLKGGKGHELKLKEEIKEDHKNEEQGVKKSDKIYVFVSFSMPKESIESLLKEAAKHNAVLVLRGLKNNSFKETAKIIKDFYDNDKRESAGFEINPELFEKHAINHVPVFLNTSNQNRLSGNVTLSFAVQKLKEEGVS
jgi:conjugal transfer pilus assembly protein TrbC